MAPISEEEPDNPFGRWLRPLMEARGLNQTTLGKASNLGQSTISSYLNGTRTPQTRQYLAQLVRALTPEDADDEYTERLFEQGLRAQVGLDPMADDPEPEHPAIDFLRGQPIEVLNKADRMLRAAFGEEDKRDSEGTVGGKRAE